ncbi:MAG: glycosyltransferase, partial [Planctomycetota bacterium]|nr:glycosyltransferase [Planctomycetota bacterium]
GIITALKAVSALLNQGKSLEYRIIGDGPEKERYLQFVRTHGLQNVVRFLGACPHSSIATHLRQSDLFIASNRTSHKGDQDAPINTLKEAMATGLPVVATRHGGIPELVEDGVSGYLIPEGDSRALQERIEWLLDHTELWGRLAELGRRRVEQEYDLEQWNDVLVQRYLEVLGRQSKWSIRDKHAKSYNRDSAA